MNLTNINDKWELIWNNNNSYFDKNNYYMKYK